MATDRVTELLAERLADPEKFQDLMDGIDAGAINPALHRALMRLDRACYGHAADVQAVLHELTRIQRVVHTEVDIWWRDEAVRLASEEAVEA